VVAVVVLLAAAALVGLSPVGQLRKSCGVGKLSRAKEVSTAIVVP